MSTFWIITRIRNQVPNSKDLPEIIEFASDLEEAYVTLIEIAGLPLAKIERLGLRADPIDLIELTLVLKEETGDVYTVSPYPYPVSLRSRRALQEMLDTMNALHQTRH